ncbi:MAG TPA: hypothetical protein VGJ04_03110, partial [Pirellulales bacterium]
MEVDVMRNRGYTAIGFAAAAALFVIAIWVAPAVIWGQSPQPAQPSQQQPTTQAPMMEPEPMPVRPLPSVNVTEPSQVGPSQVEPAQFVQSVLAPSRPKGAAQEPRQLPPELMTPESMMPGSMMRNEVGAGAVKRASTTSPVDQGGDFNSVLIPNTVPEHPSVHGGPAGSEHGGGNDAIDPFPVPPELQGIDLRQQTAEEALAKSVGCIQCHQGVGDMHNKPTVRLGCCDCHGGDPIANTKECAHVHPWFPDAWPSSANPVRTYTL